MQGEEWNLLVYDASVQAPACTEEFEGKGYGDCGVPVMWSFLIFFAFKLVAEFVLINLFVGMVSTEMFAKKLLTYKCKPVVMSIDMIICFSVADH